MFVMSVWRIRRRCVWMWRWRYSVEDGVCCWIHVVGRGATSDCYAGFHSWIVVISVLMIARKCVWTWRQSIDDVIVVAVILRTFFIGCCPAFDYYALVWRCRWRRGSTICRHGIWSFVASYFICVVAGIALLTGDTRLWWRMGARSLYHNVNFRYYLHKCTCTSAMYLWSTVFFVLSLWRFASLACFQDLLAYAQYFRRESRRWSWWFLISTLRRLRKVGIEIKLWTSLRLIRHHLRHSIRVEG